MNKKGSNIIILLYKPIVIKVGVIINMIETTAKIFKALGDPTRLKIVKLLSLRELCICELVATLDMSQPRISQHVKVLRQAGIVVERRHRQNSYLKINEDLLKGSVLKPLKSLMNVEISEIPEFREDYQRYLALDRNEDVIACKNKQPRLQKFQSII